MKNVRAVFLILPIVFLCACAGDPVGPTPSVRGASLDEDPASTPSVPTPPAAVAGGNTMGSGT